MPDTTESAGLADLAANVSWRGSLARAAVRSRLFQCIEEAPMFGRYRWLRPLGAGGMGTVVVATDPLLDREVAVKLVDADDPRLRARVIREAQANARVIHPNVIAVYDVGVAERRVYIVTELVLGVNLREWAEATPRPWREVLAAYLAAGEGLAAVHAAGLVHRDFKPANVVIGPDGRARLIDFGIARALYTDGGSLPEIDDGEAQTVVTASEHAGTPAYMAPEQFGDSTVDARADQFAFCVALWEALAGKRPGGRAAILGVCDGPWPPPLPGDTGVPAAIFRALMRGLQADPGERHVSVASLLAALRRAARPRWRRFAVVAGVAGLTLVGAAGQSRATEPSCEGIGDPGAQLWAQEGKRGVEQNLELQDSAAAREAWPRIDAALGQYAEAWQREREAACVASGADPNGPPARCFAWGLADAHQVVAELARVDHDGIARVLDRALHLPSPSRCRDPIALAIEPPVAPMHLRVPVDEARVVLADIARSMRQGELATALAQAESLIATASALGFAPLEVEVAVAVGRARAELGPFDVAKDELVHAHRLAEDIGYAAVATRAAAAVGGLLAVRLHDPVQATTWSRRALAAARATGDAELVVEAESTVALVEVALGHHSEAVELYEGLLARLQRDCAEPCAHIADVEVQLSAVYDSLGRRADAITHGRAAVTAAHDAYGRAHPTTAAAHNQLCIALDEDQNPTAALPECRAAYDVARECWGAEHPETGATQVMLAAVESALGDHASARERLVAGHGVLSRTLGDAHPYTSAALANLGLLDREAGDLVRAEQAFSAAIASIESSETPNPIELATLHHNEATALIELDRDADAVPHLERTLALREAAQVSAAELSGTRTQLGGVLWRLGQHEAAREHLEAALAAEPDGDLQFNRALRRYYLAGVVAKTDRARARRLATDALRELGDAHEDLAAECRAIIARSSLR